MVAALGGETFGGDGDSIDDQVGPTFIAGLTACDHSNARRARTVIPPGASMVRQLPFDIQVPAPRRRNLEAAALEAAALMTTALNAAAQWPSPNDRSV